MPMINVESGNTRTVEQFTRVYRKSGSETVKSQPVAIVLEEVAFVRPSNRLGKAYHRSTITLNSGKEIELAERFSTVQESLDSLAA